MLSRKPLLILSILFFSLEALTQPMSSFSIIRHGSGTRNVLFISGLSSSSSVWDETSKYFEKDFTSYAISFAGFAGNKLDKTSDFKFFEKELIQYLKDNKIQRPILVGHSLGGTIALDLAANYPEVFSKVVVVDAFPCASCLSNPLFQVQNSINIAPYVDYFKKMDSSQYSLMYKAMIADSLNHRRIVKWALASDPSAMGYFFATLTNLDLRKDLANIKCPVFVMVQPALKAKSSEIRDQYQFLKNVDVKFASKGLHFIMYDDTEWFLNELKSFFKK